MMRYAVNVGWLYLALVRLHAPQPSGREEIADYRPMRAGYRWQYNTRLNGNPGQIVRTVRKVNKQSNGYEVTIETTKEGVVTATIVYLNTREGTYLVSANDARMEPAILMISSN